MQFKHYVYIAILALGVLGVIVAAIFAEPPALQNGTEIVITAEDKARAVEYLRANISRLSPEKEVLGGTFYVTEIVWETDSSGIVAYEDGHIALRALFTVSFSSSTPAITSFVIASSS
jgi:hypothetical protein